MHFYTYAPLSGKSLRSHISAVKAKSKGNKIYSPCSYAAGRTRTGTVVHRLILSQVRLPIPPQRPVLFCSDRRLL